MQRYVIRPSSYENWFEKIMMRTIKSLFLHFSHWSCSTIILLKRIGGVPTYKILKFMNEFRRVVATEKWSTERNIQLQTWFTVQYTHLRTWVVPVFRSRTRLIYYNVTAIKVISFWLYCHFIFSSFFYGTPILIFFDGTPIVVVFAYFI